MTTFDLVPLCRSTVRFDRPADRAGNSVRGTGDDNYPPYNIELTRADHYQISLAVAGFAAEEIALVAEENVLTVQGRKIDKGEHRYLYQGISSRPFRRVFSLTDHVRVKGAALEDGMLRIELVRECP